MANVLIAGVWIGVLVLMAADAQWVNDAPTVGGKLLRAAGLVASVLGMGWFVLRAAGVL